MLNLIILYILLPFFISIFTTYFIIKILHVQLSNFIRVPEGPQKIHYDNISRLGGLSIFITIIIMSPIHYLFGTQEREFILLVLLICTPIFFFGLWEDITQIVSPKLRLFGSFLSGVLLLLIFDLSIKSIGINSINFLFAYKYISFIFTSLCIVYLIQSFNIIDGLNGLSLFTGIISFASVSAITFQLNEFDDFFLPCFFISILLGVFFYNFPFGKIFIGDSGAYVVGLLVSLSVLFLVKNNTNLSPFVIVQILIYPSYELLRSFFRRLVAGRSVFKPDTQHLHSVLYELNRAKLSCNLKKINAISSSQIIFLQILNFIYLINFYYDAKIIIVGIISFIFIYEIIYYNAKSKLRYFHEKI
jgi:UDP-N-acetylmuramyl pentapeptide phosphotransferase/UDP-N-acetylglucosamine-1-phosphate transferase